ncbi:MAG TPA: hypothetical protein VJ742_11935 [Nitrososphaera sp.]|nr:hypothetical protein [Nitrososphaera sp.]
MPKINRNAHEETHDSPIAEAAEVIYKTLAYPIFICGVNRKVNTGNFENVDVYGGIALPVMAFPDDDLEEFKRLVIEAAELGFLLASKETGDRYALIKELQGGGRKN